MTVIYNEANVPKLKLGSIKNIVNAENKKWGKKSAAYQVIKEFTDLNMSDIAIYAAIYLSRIKQKPMWTLDDLVDQLTRKDFVDENLVHFLEKSPKFEGLDDSEKKEKALLIAQSIADSEADIINIVNEHIMASSAQTNRTLAHQLTPGQLKQMLTVITKIISTLQKMYGDDKEITKLVDSIVWYTDSKKSTSVWFNTFLRDLGAHLGLALRDIRDMKKEKGTSEKEFAILNSLQKQFEGYQVDFNEYEAMNILWPESENDIKGISGLKQYFVEIEAYRTKAKTIITKYMKMKDKLMKVESEDEEDNVAIKASEWSDIRVKMLVKKTIKDNYNELLTADLEDRSNFVNKKAAELLQTRKGLEAFMSQNNHDPESELAGLLAKAIVNPNTNKGRPADVKEEI
jgi:3-methyladenine DNA glycosylase AlkC